MGRYIKVVVGGSKCTPGGYLRLRWGISQVSQTSPKQSITMSGFRQIVQPPDTVNHQSTFDTPSTEKITDGQTMTKHIMTVYQRSQLQTGMCF